MPREPPVDSPPMIPLSRDPLLIGTAHGGVSHVALSTDGAPIAERLEEYSSVEGGE